MALNVLPIPAEAVAHPKARRGLLRTPRQRRDALWGLFFIGPRRFGGVLRRGARAPDKRAGRLSSMLERRQKINLAAALVCAAMFGYALYAEKALNYLPCPLCMFQRVCIGALGVVRSRTIRTDAALWKWCGDVVDAAEDQRGVLHARLLLVVTCHVLPQRMESDFSFRSARRFSR